MATNNNLLHPMSRWRLLLALLAVVCVYAGCFALMGALAIPQHGVVAVLQDTAWQWSAGIFALTLAICVYAFRKAY